MGTGPVLRFSGSEISGLRLDQIYRVETHEAFAGQTLAGERELGLDDAKLNVNGGSHPPSAIPAPGGDAGVRLAVTLARELKRSNGRYGIASARDRRRTRNSIAGGKRLHHHRRQAVEGRLNS